ncbi:MAG: sugar O-acetyltransferase [Bacteroidales bacterium]
MEKLYRTLVFILLVILTLPGLQFITGRPVPEKPLNGVLHEVKLAPLTFANYWNFDFQKSLLKYWDRNFGFRPFFIRLYNQIQFSVFGRTSGMGVVCGKKNFLYEEWYIQEYYGNYYPGIDSIRNDIERLREIRRYLEKYNTKLLVVLAPGKPYYYPEYLPEGYPKYGDTTCYEGWRLALTGSGIPFFDVNNYFVKIKDQQPEPLYTQTGGHWSVFGAMLAGDSLIDMIAGQLNRPMNRMKITGVTWSDSLRGSDNDLADLMNLFYPAHNQKAAYPELMKIDTVPPGDRPRMVVISDSYFFNLYDGSLSHVFSDLSYWYYFSSVYPDSYTRQTFVKDIDYITKLKDADIVLLMASTAQLQKRFFGFIDTLYPVAHQELISTGYALETANNHKANATTRMNAAHTAGGAEFTANK